MSEYRDLSDVRTLGSMTEPHERLLNYDYINSTDDGHYYLTLRSWAHPDLDDATTIALRYAYLTQGSGSDGWTDYGVNMRAADDAAEFCENVGQMFLDAADQLRED